MANACCARPSPGSSFAGTRGDFRLTTAQGQVGAALYRHFGLRSDEEGTVLLLRAGTLLTDSDAAIGIASDLGWPWRAASLLRFLPRTVRDPLYRLVARNRFRLFGRRERCWLPNGSEVDHIL